MTTTIAVAGKGGVGKTTVAALTIKYLAETGRGATLAIDADPSSNLNMVLGLDLEWTVGDIREDLLTKARESVTAGGAAMGGLPGGVSKREFLDFEVRSSLSEGIDFDLIAMGRGEGPGCYCAVNHNMREVIDSIGGGYGHVVIDNEAGMEHLSRRTTRDVQHLLIVSDPTQRGLEAARRIAGFRRELDINIENAHLIINRLPAGDIPPALLEAAEKVDAPLLGTIPEDGDITEFEFTGRPVVELGSDSPVYRALAAMLEKIL
jgi:CO dehydrogenase maturation factor